MKRWINNLVYKYRLWRYPRFRQQQKSLELMASNLSHWALFPVVFSFETGPIHVWDLRSVNPMLSIKPSDYVLEDKWTIG